DLVPNLGRGPSGHEALGRPQDDRATAHPWATGLEPAGAGGVGHLGHHRTVHHGDGRDPGPYRLPARERRHRQSAGLGPGEGRDRPGAARGVRHVSTTLLRDAVRATLGFEQRWAAYSATEGEPLVLPVLVVQ